MSKIKVLVLPSDTSGVGKFRSVSPHITLQNLYPDEFHVDIDYSPKINDINYWKNYQIVHFHRSFGQMEQCPSLIKSLKSLGIIFIADIDMISNHITYTIYTLIMHKSFIARI